MVRHPQDAATDREHLLSVIGAMFTAGLCVDWANFYREQKRRRIPLPTYPFERQYFWKHALELLEMKNDGQVIQIPGSIPRRKQLENWFYLPTWLQNPIAEEHWKNQRLGCSYFDRGGLGTRLENELKSTGHEVFTAFSHDRA